MKSLNLVQLIGNLRSDPEVSDSSGKLISKFPLRLRSNFLIRRSKKKARALHGNE